MTKIGGDFLQLCHSTSIECVKVHVESHSSYCERIVKSVIEGLTQEDYTIGTILYDHLLSLGIELELGINCPLQSPGNIECSKISINMQECANYIDLLIIDTCEVSLATKLLDNRSKFISKGIIVRGVNSSDLPDNIDEFDKKVHVDCISYTRKTPATVDYESIVRTMYQYELVEAVHTAFKENGVPYCALEGTCLGCTRNRSQIIGEKIIIRRPEISKHISDLISTSLGKYNIVFNTDKIYFKEHPDVEMIVEIMGQCDSEEFNNIKIYPFGPTSIFSLENPRDYLTSLYGKDVFRKFHNPITGEITMDPKQVYDCKYNYWAPYTSQFWKDIQIEFIKRISHVFTLHNIHHWLDGGTLLGTVRNSNIPLFDDDIDIGIFKEDYNRAMHALIPNRYYIGNTPLTQNVELYPACGQLYATLKTLGVKFSNTPVSRLNGTFSAGRLGWIEIMAYYPYNDLYICDAYGHIAKSGKERIIKTGVPRNHYDTLDILKLDGNDVSCPSDTISLLESPQRYGTGTINGPARRGMKTLGTQYTP